MPESSRREWANGRLAQHRQRQAAFAFLEDGRSPGDQFPIKEVDPEALHGALVRWLTQGYAMSFGFSGDGGALGVQLVAGGEVRKKWVSTVAEAEDFLATVPGPAAAAEG